MVAQLEREFSMKVRWFLLFMLSFSLFTPSLTVIWDFLRHHKEALVVVPLWFVWLFYLLPIGSIVYDLWNFLIARKNPWKMVKFNYRDITFLMFFVISVCAWLFTHSWAIVIPPIVSTILYGFSIAKTIYLEVVYPVALGISVIIEFYQQPIMLAVGIGLIVLYFAVLNNITRRKDSVLNTL